jgi:para-aminobenzoate synthetase component 1
LTQNQNKIITVKALTLKQNIDCQSLFSVFAKQAWSMWLDSYDGSHLDGQFDIMVWQPNITLVTEGERTTTNDVISGQKSVSFDDPLTVLEASQEKFFAQFTIDKKVDCKLPFLSGALGYFSYDLGRRFEHLPQQALKDIELPEMAVGLYNKAIIFDHSRHTYFLICPEDEREEITSLIMSKIHAMLSSQVTVPFSLTTEWQSSISKKQYLAKFNQVQEYLRSGDCYQINLTQRFSSQYKGDEFTAYLALRHHNKAPFSAFIRFDNQAILSVSPERFVQLHGQKVQSKPIKGTYPRGATAKQDKQNATKLANSSKDKAENLMIVDLLRNDISKVCIPGTVKVPYLFAIESFPAVHHLVSTVEGHLSSVHKACDLIRAAFPGGSITGAPKIRAMQIIEELEPQRRSIYCGSIGYISACGNMDTSITIRTLACEQHSDGNNFAYCWAGGGIVADSKADDEYQETFDKVNKILPILSRL